ncbi:MAG: dihydropteroate synthase [Candidatus Azotimanducaceae bacterium]|jgi:dihydropteroate synthase
MLFPTDRPAIMGVLNVTPDSFSDGGRFVKRDDAMRHAEKMILSGVDIIDVGGESTRPGAGSVSTSEELERVVPVIEAIRAMTDLPISVDTSTAAVMTAAAAVGASLLNDVRALRLDGALEAASATGLPVCLMHMQGDPQTMQMNPVYDDLMTDVRRFFIDRIEVCVAAGIQRERIVLDPGFGFGKTPQHNLQLINQLDTFADLGCPLLVGLSRKSTIGKVLESIEGDRLIGSLVGAVWAYMRGASILRVHDVAETRAALVVSRAFSTNGNDFA